MAMRKADDGFASEFSLSLHKADDGFASEYSRSLHKTYVRLGVYRADSRLPRLFPISPLPIQTLAIPYIARGRDAVVRAIPRSGKTTTYFIGLAERFYGIGLRKDAPFAMIILPTTRLCLRVVKLFNRRCSPNIKAGFVGSAAVLLSELSNGSPDVVVATPDLALALLRYNHSFLQKSLRVLVFDKVDILLSRGFKHHLKSLRAGVQESCQCLVFSANPSADVKNLKNFVRHNPYVLTLTTDGRLVAELSPYNLKHFYIPCKKGDKFPWICYYLSYMPNYSKVLVLTNSDKTSSELLSFIQTSNPKEKYMPSVLLAGWTEEPPALKDFNTAEFGLLIATDYTPPAANQTMRVGKARNHSEQELDLECAVFKNVDIVVHFDMPDDAPGYGRRILCTTRRASSHIGESVSLACLSDKKVFEEIKTWLRSGETLNKNVLVTVPEFGWLIDDPGVEYPLSYDDIMENLLV